ncbi:hypothetical protein V8C43DRAFT_13125 [Trichoderma afarasin]
MAGISEYWSSLISVLFSHLLPSFTSSFSSLPFVVAQCFYPGREAWHTLNSNEVASKPSYTSRPWRGGLDAMAPLLYDSLKPAPTSHCRLRPSDRELKTELGTGSGTKRKTPSRLTQPAAASLWPGSSVQCLLRTAIAVT